MKMPKLPRIAFPRRPKKLQASTAATRRAPIADDYYDEEPKTNLSSAFIVVLILHVVAVGGIYTFNSIRAARRGPEAPSSSSADAASTSTSLLAKASAAPAIADAGRRDSAQNAPPAPLKSGTYRVQAGDTLTKVALLHGLTVSDLAQANELKNADGIKDGQVLNIPAAKPAPKIPAVPDDPRKAAFLAAKVDTKPATATSNGASRTYVVVKGDTPISIARKFGTTSTELLKLNKIDDPKKLQPGQTLKVPKKN